MTLPPLFLALLGDAHVDTRDASRDLHFAALRVVGHSGGATKRDEASAGGERLGVRLSFLTVGPGRAQRLAQQRPLRGAGAAARAAVRRLRRALRRRRGRRLALVADGGYFGTHHMIETEAADVTLTTPGSLLLDATRPPSPAFTCYAGASMTFYNATGNVTEGESSRRRLAAVTDALSAGARGARRATPRVDRERGAVGGRLRAPRRAFAPAPPPPARGRRALGGDGGYATNGTAAASTPGARQRNVGTLRARLDDATDEELLPLVVVRVHSRRARP